MDYIETHKDGVSSGKRRNNRAIDDMGQLLKQQRLYSASAKTMKGVLVLCQKEG